MTIKTRSSPVGYFSIGALHQGHKLAADVPKVLATLQAGLATAEHRDFVAKLAANAGDRTS